MSSDVRSVKVVVVDLINSIVARVVLPTNVRVGKLLPYLVKELGLPFEAPSGALIQYYLIHEVEEGKIRLQDDQTLAQAGIQDDSRLGILFNRRPVPESSQARSEEWTYLDFELQIIYTAKGYQTQVLASPAGEVLEPFEPLDSIKAENLVLRMSRTRRGVRSIGSPQWEAARELGQELYRRLFHGEVKAHLSASLREAQNQDCGLRLKLRLDNVPELMDLPWEFLYNAPQREFLALREETPIVRFVNVQEYLKPTRVKLPLHILALIASPTDLPALDFDQEREGLTRALQPLLASGAITIDWIEAGSRNALFTHLKASQKHYHIFHFIGHGGFDNGEGYLAMVGPGGRSEPVTGERLATLLRVGRRRFRLVVLNTCEGARISITDPFASVATSLMVSGRLPAVLAMQFEITNAAAIVFAENFYEALSMGRPVDRAVTLGRVAIDCMGNDIEWGTPVLYMRLLDGHLFDFS